MQHFIDIAKNISLIIVIGEIFCGIAVTLLVIVSNHVTEDEIGPEERRTGKHTFCALTARPCVYSDQYPDACEGCPEAQKHFYTEEQNVDKVRGIQDEGRADKIP